MKDLKNSSKSYEVVYSPAPDFNRADCDANGRESFFGFGSPRKRGEVTIVRMQPTTVEKVARFKERFSLGLESKQLQTAAVPEKPKTTLKHPPDEALERTLARWFDPTSRGMGALIRKPQVSCEEIQASARADALASADKMMALIGESKAWLQDLRDEVRAMVAVGKPLNGISLYRGRPLDGPPVDFFHSVYGKFGRVIFSQDLAEIDRKLLVALRNQCAKSGVALPILTSTDRTEAIASGLFVDGEKSQSNAQTALAMRLSHSKKQSNPPGDKKHYLIN